MISLEQLRDWLNDQLPGAGPIIETLPDWVLYVVFAAIVLSLVWGGVVGLLRLVVGWRDACARNAQRASVSDQAAGRLGTLLFNLSDILAHGQRPKARTYESTYVVIGDAKPQRYVRLPTDALKERLEAYDGARDALSALIDQYAAIFPPRGQNALTNLGAHLQRVDGALSIIRLHFGASSSYTLKPQLGSYENIKEWQSFMRDIEASFGKHSKMARAVVKGCKRSLETLKRVDLLSYRAVLYGKFPIIVPLVRDYSEVDFDEIVPDVRVLAHIPENAVWDGPPGLRDVEEILRVAGAAEALDQMEPFVAQEHRAEFEQLRRRVHRPS